MLVFEWDHKKAIGNIDKHGVSFQESSTVFSDLYSLSLHDPLHSNDEDRFIIIGISNRNNLLIVVHTERLNSIRIISARKATKTERNYYENNAR